MHMENIEHNLLIDDKLTKNTVFINSKPVLRINKNASVD
jgi:hypothetical protein